VVATVINGFNIGSDVSFAIMDQYGDVFSEDMLGLMTQFDIRSVDVKMKVTPISNNGVPINQVIPNGLRGTMTFVRIGPAFSQLYMDLSQGYFTAGIITQMYIMMNVRNRDGSVDEYQLDGVQLSDWDFGDFRGTKEVDCKMSIEASQMYGSGSLAVFLNNLPG
jgi:hypothetical protein